MTDKTRRFDWYVIDGSKTFSPLRVMRAKVPGGWLLRTEDYEGHATRPCLTFVSDPEHKWDGNTLE